MQEFSLPWDYCVIDTEAKQIKQNVLNMMDTANLLVFQMTKVGVFSETYVNEILLLSVIEKVGQLPAGLTGTLSWQP